MYHSLKAVFGVKGIVITMTLSIVITVFMIKINTSQQNQLTLELNMNGCEPVRMDIEACRRIIQIGVSPTLFKKVKSYRDEVRVINIRQTLSHGEKVQKLANLTLEHAAKKQIKLAVKALQHIESLTAAKERLFFNNQKTIKTINQESEK